MKKITKFLVKNFWPILVVLLALLAYVLYKNNEGFKTYNKPNTKKKGVNEQAKDKKTKDKKKK